MLLDNWTLATTFNAQTGTPYTEFDCSYAYTVCPRASFVTKPNRNKGTMTDLSNQLGANTYSYLHLPDFYDPNNLVTGVNAANYNEQINPNTGTSDTPICAGLHGVGCSFVPGMDGRNAFRGPGSWDQNLGAVKDFKIRERYDIQLKGEFINIFNHANTYLDLGGANDVSTYTDVLAYKSGNRNSEFSVHIAF
jgi:hypothetical protein